MDISKYKEFLYGNPEYKELSFEDKVLRVAKKMILNFDKAQKEENESRKEEIVFNNSCKANEDFQGFVMKIQGVLYELSYEEVKENLSKNILGKIKTDEYSIERTIFSLLEEKRKSCASRA